MLVRREYSAVELAKKLQSKEFTEDEITQAIEKLQEQKYQSDDRFAEMIINTRVSQGKGKLIIKQELKQHQIDDFDTSEIDFYKLCKKVKIQKFGEEKYQDLKAKSKQIRFLQSRGFSFDEISNSIGK
jgi:regulatory protein